MDAIIFDIDGTLADVGHRRHHVTGGKREWDRFFEAMVDDPPLADVCLLADLLGQTKLVQDGEVTLFLCSGRPDNYRAETESWLAKYAPSYFDRAEALLMRAAGDYRPDTEVKREMLRGIEGQGYEVRLVVDDRPSVIEMWKSEGLTVLAHDGGEWEEKQRTWKPGTLQLMVGPSGGGKSSWIRSEIEYGSLDPRIVVSSDDFRDQITGDFRDQSANDQMWSALHAVVKARIEGGLHTLVDATNLHARDRRALRDLCPPGTQIIYYVVDRPLAAKHQTAGWRNDVVIKGVKLIDKHHQAFQSGVKHILRGDDDPRVTVWDYRSKG